ncbi:succinoglycan biosynthesis protein ExoW [Rhodoferax sp. OV413]|uniref:glycosyltransferase family 2 protein n=1 Tax=Rhodoferax sp. OV413 TaxID=1855285 RepID=UPI00088F389D|nr:glycosyltransferase family 2 protein [Rhodoferax sp. OV413]SDP85800.1 succinoglycan biosynthesis protein ExoW [Rhodoferax sp. OV413]
MITVIIPYYQKESGILTRALASIAAQQSPGMAVHVLIVDDASPISAESEVKNLNPNNHTLQIIKQNNGGPGSARNTGINNAPPQTRYIAFLDSDDEWSPDHLRRAVTAMGVGFDFYFADHHQLGATVGAFARAGRIRPEDHPQIPLPDKNIHAYTGDLLDQIIRGNVIGTSTVVYDFLRFPDKRFKIEFTNAGEDYLFWMDIAHSGAKGIFSNQSEAKYGRGVNIYAGTGWGNEKHLLRIHNEIKYKKLICDIFPITPLQHSHIIRDLKSLRFSFAQDLLHRVFHRKKLPLSLLREHFVLDPLSFLLLPLALLSSLTQRRKAKAP